LWVRANYPGVEWPYLRPADHNVLLPVLEEKLRELLPEVSEMNTWTDFAKLGPVTSFPSQFRLNFNGPLPLSKIRSAMRAQAEVYGCTNLDIAPATADFPAPDA
jgi:hypothetical protein